MLGQATSTGPATACRKPPYLVCRAEVDLAGPGAAAHDTAAAGGLHLRLVIAPVLLRRGHAQTGASARGKQQGLG
jgi:hypothetical protein